LLCNPGNRDEICVELACICLGFVFSAEPAGALILETSGRTNRPNDVGKLIEVRQNLFSQLDAALVIVQIAVILKLALGQLQLCALPLLRERLLEVEPFPAHSNRRRAVDP
jgi:hypothetical protein